MFKAFVAAAFVLRILLMPISVHSDLFFINSFPSLVWRSGVYDIFSYMSENFPERNYTYYPPLTYYTFGIFQLFYNAFSDTFSEWMYKLYKLEEAGFAGQAADFIREAPNDKLFRDIFLAKLPYIFFDVGILAILFRLVKSKLLEKEISLVWLFNPVHIYGTYIMGQFDIIPTFFIFLGILMFNKHLKLALFFFGLGLSYKTYPIIFILPILLIYSRSLASLFKLSLLSFFPFVLFLIPSIIGNFVYSIFAFLPKVYLVDKGKTTQWQVFSNSFKYTLLLVAQLLNLFFAAAANIKDKRRFSIGISLISILLIYAIAPRISFHYLLWATPFIFLWFKRANTCAFIIGFQSFSLASYKLLANHLQAGLFAPLNAQYFSNLPTINGIINLFFPYRIISTIGFFAFLGFNLYLILLIVKELLFESETRSKISTMK